jgi:hypothetical protein
MEYALMQNSGLVAVICEISLQRADDYMQKTKLRLQICHE